MYFPLRNEEIHISMIKDVIAQMYYPIWNTYARQPVAPKLFIDVSYSNTISLHQQIRSEYRQTYLVSLLTELRHQYIDYVNK